MKGKSILMAALLVCSVLAAGVAMTGGAVAQTSTDTPTGDDPIDEETLGVDNDTRSVQALASNATGSLDVTVYGVDDEGNETEVDTGTIDATGNTTDTYEYTSLEPSTYPEYRVVVDGDAAAETVEIAKVQVVAGGAGGLLGGLKGMAVPGAAVAVLGLAALVGAAIYTGRY